jgi:DNA ligase-1
MTTIFKPMLATDAVLEKLRFPLLASPKLDGVRAIVRDGVVYSRSNKPIPNKAVQAKFAHYSYYDGELIVGNPCSNSVYRDTVSTVMAHDKGAESVVFHAFDHVEKLGASYVTRRKELEERAKFVAMSVVLNPQREIGNLQQLEDFEVFCLELGYEGLILRDPNAPYKNGRSTVNEGYLLKMKRFVDAEFEVIGYEERMYNGNEATTNELGRTKRSSHKAGKVGLGDLGALVLRGDGFTFSVGTGFDDAARKHLWEIRDVDLVGRLAKIKYFPIGMKEAPRHPVFLGWRDAIDLS